MECAERRMRPGRIAPAALCPWSFFTGKKAENHPPLDLALALFLCSSSVCRLVVSSWPCMNERLVLLFFPRSNGEQKW